MFDEQSAAEAFARLAVEMYDAEGVDDTVEAVVQFALHAVGCRFASVVLVARGQRPEITALTDPKLAELYHQQIDADEGPLITAIQQGRVLQVRDVLTETRWSPIWAEQVLAAGIRSGIHVPLVVGDRPSAVLSLYSDLPDAFTVDDVAVAHILAQHATVAIADARRTANLVTAVDARKLVGQAMGILMERYDLDGDRAFEVLKRYSQHTNRKLRDVAQELIDTRRLRR